MRRLQIFLRLVIGIGLSMVLLASGCASRTSAPTPAQADKPAGQREAPETKPALHPAEEIHRAAERGDLTRLKALLSLYPALVHARDRDLEAQPLIWASRSGGVEASELLLRRGAEVNERDGRGQTALHWAAGGGYIELCRLLIFSGADVGAGDQRGFTPLHRAARTGYPGVCELLLEGGAEPNARNDRGETPLHLAAGSGSYEVCEILIFWGAEVNIRTGEGKIPLDYAEEGDHRQVIELLRFQGSS